jgi:hypothetical protein
MFMGFSIVATVLVARADAMVLARPPLVERALAARHATVQRTRTGIVQMT